MQHVLPINAMNLTRLKFSDMKEMALQKFQDFKNEFKPLRKLNLQFFAGTQNKVKFGLKNVYYAKVIDSGTAITYETPKRQPGAVSLSLTPNGEIVEFAADDITYFSSEINNGYDGELEIADITEDFETEILGLEADTVKGVVYETTNIANNKFALMYEINGDVKARRYVLYYCTASRPNIEGSTQTGNTVEPKTSKLSFKSRPMPYQINNKNYIRANTTPAATTVFDGWFADVHLPTTVTP